MPACPAFFFTNFHNALISHAPILAFNRMVIAINKAQKKRGKL